jgi:HEAT repeats
MTFQSIRTLNVIVLFATACSATIVPSSDAGRLRDAADLVLVGQVTAVLDGSPTLLSNPGGTISGHPQTASILIARVLKGSHDVGATSITYFVPDVPNGFGSVAPGQFGVFFLSQLTDQVWAPADPYHFVLPALTVGPSLGGDATTAEVLAVLGSSQAAAADRTIALGALRQVSGPDMTAALRSAMASTDRQLHWSAAGALLTRGDLDALTSVRAILMASLSADDQPYVDGIGTALRGEAQNSQAVPMLVAILSSVNPEIRRGAALAIGLAGGATAISSLPGSLSDPDMLVRYYAVVGLGRATNQPDWTPSLDVFQSNEQQWLAYWKSQFPSCASDVSAQFTVSRGGFRLNNATKRYVQSVTVTRKAAGATGPFALVLDGLSANATLFGAAGTTACSSPAGSPYLIVPGAATWATGDAVSLQLEFVNPTNGGIVYTPRVLAGGPNR